jgi:hypothetical protein
MTHQEIKELAGHRAVSPWVMKLVNDAVMKEREACAERAWIALVKHKQPWNIRQDVTEAIKGGQA